MDVCTCICVYTYVCTYKREREKERRERESERKNRVVLLFHCHLLKKTIKEDKKIKHLYNT